MAPALNPTPIRLSVLGCGTVGSAVIAGLRERAEEFTARIGRPLLLTGIAVHNLSKPRPGIDRALLSDDPAAVIAEADIVVEVMGGLNPARELIAAALKQGTSVVSANKALLATHPKLFDAARDARVTLAYEAAVAGAIPIVRAVERSLAGDEIESISGIINGTTNVILGLMAQGQSYAEALAYAQEAGFAEADPTADVEGYDAAAKIALLANAAFRTRITLDQVNARGITQIHPADLAAAKRDGQVIKLVAHARRESAGVVVAVTPTRVDRAHPLAAIEGPMNAVTVQARGAGPLTFTGAGAGGPATASAVLADVVAVAQEITAGARWCPPPHRHLPVIDSPAPTYLACP